VKLSELPPGLWVALLCQSEEQNATPTSSLRGPKARGNPVGAKRPCGRTGLPRRTAPRNDEVENCSAFGCTQGWAGFCAAKPHLASPDQPSAVLRPSALSLFLHGLKAGFACFQTQDNPAKSRVLLLAVHNNHAATA
jgi:hypothetical protein